MNTRRAVSFAALLSVLVALTAVPAVPEERLLVRHIGTIRHQDAPHRLDILVWSDPDAGNYLLFRAYSGGRGYAEAFFRFSAHEANELIRLTNEARNHPGQWGRTDTKLGSSGAYPSHIDVVASNSPAGRWVQWRVSPDVDSDSNGPFNYDLSLADAEQAVKILAQGVEILKTCPAPKGDR